MDSNEQLNTVLDDLINDKSEQAQIEFHDYLQSKIQNTLNPDSFKIDDTTFDNTDYEE